MYSIDFNQNLIKGIMLIDIDKLNPHEKIIEKKYIIDIGKSSVLLEPKSTEHAVYCNKSKNWEPIILLSSMFKIETKEIIK